jgi:BirA family biotin operon repressor/biotin-[acetyl-CoA-carboxylase] ligase
MGAVAPDLAGVSELLASRGGELGRTVHLLGTTTSTNDDAKHGAKNGAPHGSVWIAETQTAGRGRQGRSWTSPAGENLLFSVLVRVDLEPVKIPRLALVAGLAVRDAVARAAPAAEVKIKWPNDVLVGGRKVAGILVESVTTGSGASRAQAVVVGVGINVHTRMFPAAIAGRATSIALLNRESRAERGTVLADVLAALDRDVHVVGGRGLGLVRARIEDADALAGKVVKNDSGDEGTACGIDDDGKLMVRRTAGTLVRWSSGEVHLIGSSDAELADG